MAEGKYIVIEGNDGTGKSTQVGIIRKKLAEQGISSVEFHEPAGVPVADEIRTIIKNGELARDGETNLLLFTAARHEIWKHAQQQLKLGTWVVAARNYYSTLAYQGYGEGLNLALIEGTTRTFTNDAYMDPDVAVVLTLDGEQRESRIALRGEIEKRDTFESREVSFQNRVNEGYEAIAKQRQLPIIDASRTISAVNEDIWSIVSKTIQ